MIMPTTAEQSLGPVPSFGHIMDPSIVPFEQLAPVSELSKYMQLFQQLQELILNAGPVMLLLGVFSVVGLSVVFVKLLQFLRSSVWSRRVIEKILRQWQQGQIHEAMILARKTRHPAGVVLLAAMEGIQHFGDRNETVREEVERVAVYQLNKHGRYLSILDIISQLAPLMGLLGTILGMITAFQALQGSGTHADPAVLAGGIWEALLTTAAGLSVAIPMTVFYYLLDGHVQSTRHFMEDAVTRVFTISQHISEIVQFPHAMNNPPVTSPVTSKPNGMSGAYAVS